MSLKQTADKAKNLGKQLQAVIEVGQVLDELGDLEIAKNEYLRDSKQAYEKKIQTQDELKEVQKLLKKASERFDVIKKDATKLETESIERKNLIIGTARAEGDKIKKNSEKYSNDLIEQVQADVKYLEETRTARLTEINSLNTRLEYLRDEMKALQERLG